MSPKRDIRQLDAIGEEFDMDPDERIACGEFIEECKSKGDFGSAKNGDFIYAELREKAREFFEERS